MNGLIISGLDATVLTDRGFAAVLAAVLAAVVGLLVVPPSPVSRIHPVTMPPLPWASMRWPARLTPRPSVPMPRRWVSTAWRWVPKASLPVK